MGDILGRPRHAPPPFGVSRACSFGGAHAQGFDYSNPSRRRRTSFPAAPPGPRDSSRKESYDCFNRARWPGERIKQLIAPHLTVKRAWARVALGWVTSLNVLVLHLLLLASVGLVLLVARTRKVSIAQILLGGGGRAFQRRLPGLEIHPGKKVMIVSSARGGLEKA
ncbi:hypothetical protein VNO77_27133 [Canavalia gladiata]|uniref:Uncharacterized protein n=1 Tax=Canavalia gladiata TaxID=3824 RepID=A0AAN9KTK5_CANGL